MMYLLEIGIEIVKVLEEKKVCGRQIGRKVIRLQKKGNVSKPLRTIEPFPA